MVLVNHVILQNNIPSRLHFRDHRIQARTITDPTTRQPVIRNTLEFDVDRLDSRPVGAVFSTMAEKLAGLFEPYLKDKSYVNFDYIITQAGDGYLRTWTVKVEPLVR